MSAIDALLLAVLAVWRDVLPAEAVGPIDADTDLFDVGGTSLTAAVIATATRIGTGRVVRMRTVMENPTPRALTAALADAPRAVDRPAGALSPTGVGATSAQQQTIWFLEKLLPFKTAYNSVVAVHITGPLDVDRLRAACADTQARHELLHSRFDVVEGSLTRVTEPVPGLGLELRTVTERVLEVAQQLAAVPFDIARAPLIRWYLLETSADEHTLVQVEHHLVHDGWSTWIVLTDIAAHYRAAAAEQACDDGAYDRFAREQHSWLETPEGMAQRDAWRRSLEPVLPTGAAHGPDWSQPRPRLFTAKGATVESWLPVELAAGVAGLATYSRTTPFVVLWTAFAALIGRHRTGDDGFAIGSMLRNRPDAGAERVVGMYVNTVALPVHDWRSLPFAELAARNQDAFLAAEDRAAVPFPTVVSDLGVPRDLSRNPVFQECFSMIDWPGNELDLGPGVSAVMAYPTNGGAKFDLDVVVMPEGATFRCLWRYYSEILDAERVQTLIDEYHRMLAEAVAVPGTPCADLLGAMA